MRSRGPRTVHCGKHAGFAGWLINTIVALDNPAITACSEEQQLNFICGSGADQICNPMGAPHSTKKWGLSNQRSRNHM